MKKLLFVAHSLQSGGIERALINLFSLIDYSDWEVSLLLLRSEGELLKELPPEIRLLRDYKSCEWTELFCTTWRRYLKKSISKRDQRGLSAVLTYLFQKIFRKSDANRLYEPFLREVEPIEGRFDLAIDFYGGGSVTTFITWKKVNALKKITWVHSEVAIQKICEIQEVLNDFTRIFCVSQRCMDLFSARIPEYSSKCKPFYNYVPVEMIKEKSLELPEYEFDRNDVNLLTVGRISPEKGLYLALRASFLLRKTDPQLRWKWYFIGNGPSLRYLKLLAKMMRLSDRLIFLGYQENPYCYIKSCDIYVQPSQFEGYCTTITEASILCRPVIATNVSGVKEQIENGRTGLITEYSQMELYRAILRLIKDPDMRLKMEENRRSCIYDFEREIEKISDILSDS